MAQLQMDLNILPRQLWYEIDGRTETLEQGALLLRPELLVVLGEPGMGKSELLR